MIKVFISQGNGKTLTAIGASIKAAKCGEKVVFTQFLTNGEDSELKMLQKNDHIAVLMPEAVPKKYWEMVEEEKEKTRIDMIEHFERIVNLVQTGCCDMLVLDYVLDLCEYGLIDRFDLVDFLKKVGNKIEIVITGEKLTREIMEVSDYISDIRKIRDLEPVCFVEIEEKI